MTWLAKTVERKLLIKEKKIKTTDKMSLPCGPAVSVLDR